MMEDDNEDKGKRIYFQYVSDWDVHEWHSINFHCKWLPILIVKILRWVREK